MARRRRAARSRRRRRARWRRAGGGAWLELCGRLIELPLHRSQLRHRPVLLGRLSVNEAAPGCASSGRAPRTRPPRPPPSSASRSAGCRLELALGAERAQLALLPERRPRLSRPPPAAACSTRVRLRAPPWPPRAPRHLLSSASASRCCSPLILSSSMLASLASHLSNSIIGCSLPWRSGGRVALGAWLVVKGSARAEQPLLEAARPVVGPPPLLLRRGEIVARLHHLRSAPTSRPRARAAAPCGTRRRGRLFSPTCRCSSCCAWRAERSERARSSAERCSPRAAAPRSAAAASLSRRSPPRAPSRPPRASRLASRTATSLAAICSLAASSALSSASLASLSAISSSPRAAGARSPHARPPPAPRQRGSEPTPPPARSAAISASRSELRCWASHARRGRPRCRSRLLEHRVRAAHHLDLLGIRRRARRRAGLLLGRRLGCASPPPPRPRP